jgi:hypothetical protein
MKFRLSSTFAIDTDLAPWKTEGLRIGLWGGSGCGKSNTAALFAEQFLSQGGTVVIFEPRAEYHTLKEKWDVVVCGGPYAKDIDFIPSSPATYAKAVVEQGVSIIFYTTDVEDETKLIEFISRFLHYLLKYNEEVKRPIMLIVEETDEYAPISTKGRVSPPWVFSRMIKAFKTASRDARKLNIVPIAISPRPQEINFTIRQLCNLTFYGKFAPQDIHYIESQCLKYYEHSFYTGNDLLDLQTGQFAVITSGQTLPLQTITQPRLTKHGAETPKLTYIAPHKEETKKAVTDLTETIQKALEKERLEESELQKLQQRFKTVVDQYEKLAKEHEQLKLQAETLGKIKVEGTWSYVSPAEYETVKAERDKLQKDLETIVDDIKQGILAVFNNYETAPPSKPTPNLYPIWEPKMPSPCARKLFRFLLDNAEAKFTKSELGVKTGYSPNSGGFNNAISFLKRNNLIKYDGRFVWCEQ